MAYPQNYGYRPSWSGFAPQTYPPQGVQIPKADGPDDAKAYPLGPGSSAAIFDANNPVFYVKSTDPNGFPEPLRTFRFEEIVPQAETAREMEDISELKAQVEELRKMVEELM